MKTATGRQNYLDWLRILAIFGVLIYHSARPFITDDPWHINNEETRNLLMKFNFWLSRFRMHYFICGIAMIFIPVFLFPVVRNKYKSLATAYIVFRALEGKLFVYLAIKTLFFIPLSETWLYRHKAISTWRLRRKL